MLDWTWTFELADADECKTLDMVVGHLVSEPSPVSFDLRCGDSFPFASLFHHVPVPCTDGPELTQLFDVKNVVCPADPRHGRCLTST